jgi:hypothetical protein
VDLIHGSGQFGLIPCKNLTYPILTIKNRQNLRRASKKY